MGSLSASQSPSGYNTRAMGQKQRRAGPALHERHIAAVAPQSRDRLYLKRNLKSRLVRCLCGRGESNFEFRERGDAGSQRRRPRRHSSEQSWSTWPNVSSRRKMLPASHYTRDKRKAEVIALRRQCCLHCASRRDRCGRLCHLHCRQSDEQRHGGPGFVCRGRPDGRSLLGRAASCWSQLAVWVRRW
jgi:hypothetical protein